VKTFNVLRYATTLGDGDCLAAPARPAVSTHIVCCVFIRLLTALQKQSHTQHTVHIKCTLTNCRLLGRRTIVEDILSILLLDSCYCFSSLSSEQHIKSVVLG